MGMADNKEIVNKIAEENKIAKENKTAVENKIAEESKTAEESKIAQESKKAENKMPENQTIIKHYDNLIAQGNDPFYDPLPLKQYMDKWDGASFLKELKVNKECEVLEIGVGTGRLAVRVLELGCKTFTGIDLSLLTLEKAGNNLSDYNNVHLIAGDFLQVELIQKFDIIYSSLTFFHIKRKKEAIDKIWSLLNTNGRFILSIDKNQQEYLEYGSKEDGNYTLKMYPDNPENIMIIMKLIGFYIENTIETEFAYIFSAVKPKE